MKALLTDTFGIEQLQVACTISVDRVEVDEVRAALSYGFDVHFEFEELAEAAQNALGINVPMIEQPKRPTFGRDFTVFVIGYEYSENTDCFLTFWKVQWLTP